MNLSPHFTLEEMTNNGKSGTPNEKQIQCLRALCVNILEPLRENFDRPIRINSGFRSVEHELSKGRKGNSQHCKGEAVDIEIEGVSNMLIWLKISMCLPFDQMIAEKLERNNPSAGWIHVSYSDRHRREKLSFNGHDYVPGFQWYR